MIEERIDNLEKDVTQLAINIELLKRVIEDKFSNDIKTLVDELQLNGDGMNDTNKKKKRRRVKAKEKEFMD